MNPCLCAPTSMRPPVTVEDLVEDSAAPFCLRSSDWASGDERLRRMLFRAAPRRLAGSLYGLRVSRPFGDARRALTTLRGVDGVVVEIIYRSTARPLKRRIRRPCPSSRRRSARPSVRFARMANEMANGGAGLVD